ncbi:Peflin [Entamoeba marina]
MSVFSTKATTNSWIFQSVNESISDNDPIKLEWWYPLCTSIDQDEYMELMGWFKRIDTDKSGTLSLSELVAIKWFQGIKLEEEACKKLMHIFDLEQSGRISFYAMLAMRKYVELLLDIFSTFDKDKNGTMNVEEMMDALPYLGFEITERNCRALMNTNAKGVISKKIKISQFIQCAAHLGLIRSIYQKTVCNNLSFKREDFKTFMNMILLIQDDF